MNLLNVLFGLFPPYRDVFISSIFFFLVLIDDTFPTEGANCEICATEHICLADGGTDSVCEVSVCGRGCVWATVPRLGGVDVDPLLTVLLDLSAAVVKLGTSLYSAR